MTEKLEFDLSVKQNELSKALKDASTQAESLNKKLSFTTNIAPNIESVSDSFEKVAKQISKTKEETGFAIDFIEQFKTQALGVAAGQFVFQAVNDAINFVTSSIKESVQAFSEQEDAINRLGQSLNATQSFSQSAVDGVLSFASALEKTSKLSDDAIIGQVAFARSLGLTTDQAKELVKAAANLSATLGGTLEENVTKLGKVMSGDLPRGLSALIPELKSFTKEQLKAGAATELVNSKFSGAAANELNTYSGAVQALKNSFNNLQETTGEVIVKSSLFQSVITKLKSTIDETNTAIEAGKIFDDYAKGQGIASKTAEQLANDYVKLGTEIQNLTVQLDEQAKRSSFAKLIFDDDTSAVIKKQIDDLVNLRSEIDTRLQTGRLSIPKEKAEAPDLESQNVAEIEAAKKRSAELLAIDAQLRLARENFKTEEYNATIAGEAEKNAAEIARIFEFETQKREIDAQLKAQTAQATLEGDALALEIRKINKEKELALLDLANKKEISLLNNKVKEEKRIKDEVLRADVTRLSYLNQQTAASFGLAAALAKDGGAAQFFINKAGALAQVAIARATGIANALLLPPPAQPAAIANANIIAGLSAATIAATSIKGFAEGGIVGATSGPDNRVATIRDGEMILNANQQKNLMDMINSGSGGGDIVIQINEREIARAVRSQVQQGFRLA